MRQLGWMLLLAAGISGCQTPPKSAYVALQDNKTGTVPAGTNRAGETCRRLDLGGGAADIYCGEWDRPSARVRQGGPAAGADLAALANGQGAGAAWRGDIEARFSCQPPRPTTILGNAPAQLMECQYRNGGFPQLALVAAVGGHVWYADSIDAAYDVTQRGIGTLAGVRAEEMSRNSEPDPQLAARLAARSFKASDLRDYQTFMREAADANRQGNTSAAEKLYRSVIDLQEKVIGRDNPNLATAVMSLGLQLSNQGRFAEADAFARAEQLIGPAGGDPTTPPAGSDETARARLLQYRALDAVNRGKPADALKLLDQSEVAYRLLADQALTAPAGNGAVTLQTLQSTSIEALFGVIDVKRDRAWTLRRLGRLADSDREAQAAQTLALNRLPETSSHWRERETAFLYRTAGLTVAQEGQSARAIGLFNDADRDFARVYASTRPQAETKLRAADELLRDGQAGTALARCREAVDILARRKDGVDAELMAPCLDTYAATATGADAQKRLAEMFEAAEQVRSSQTNQQIQQAARRISENTRDPKVAELIRQRDEADKKLDELERRRVLAAQTGGAAGAAAAAPAVDPAVLAALDRDIETATRKSAALEDALQSASPSYNQLVPKVVAASDIMAALHPGEAFVVTVLSEKAGWTFLLRDGKISIGPISGGRARVEPLVRRIRHTLQPDEDTGNVLPFDTAAAQELYSVVLGPVDTGLRGATTLTVSPAGPLLSVPFAVLLTGAVKPHDYAGAPWLVKRFAIAHVPEPGNFLALRKLAGTSRAPMPWFGFGDAANVTVAQAAASFPAASCGAAAEELAGLPVLSDAAQELNASRTVLGAAPADELTGPAFTAEAVEKLKLNQFRILHFAAHGLLPTDLACQAEPAIVTSAPPGAANASGALLTASRVEKLDLDAELVILSACNSGGPGGATSGESLSGLARSFFAAKARALMVSHWELSSAAATALIPATLATLKQQPRLGIAGALRAAQLLWLKTYAGQNSHPFVWGAMAVFGDGGGGGAVAATPQATILPPSHQG